MNVAPLKYKKLIGLLTLVLISLFNHHFDEVLAQLPSEKKCVSDLGLLNIDDNGDVLGKNTHLTELFKLLQKNDCDIIDINYRFKNRPDYPEKSINKRTCLQQTRPNFTRYFYFNKCY